MQNLHQCFQLKKKKIYMPCICIESNFVNSTTISWKQLSDLYIFQHNSQDLGLNIDYQKHLT